MREIKVEVFDGVKAYPLGVRTDWSSLGKEADSKAAAALASVVATLYRGTELRGQQVGGMPFDIFSGDEVVYSSDSKEPPPDAKWLADLPELLVMTESSATLRGGAYWFKLRDRGEEEIGVRWLKFDSIEPKLNKPGEPGFNASEPVNELLYFERDLGGGLAKPKRLDIDDVVYFWSPDPSVEIGPAQDTPGRAALAAAGVLEGMDTYLASYFKRGMVAQMLLRYGIESDISEDEQSRIKEWWNRATNGVRNAWNTLVLRDDFVIEKIGEGISELGDAELTQEKREDIAIALGVPQSQLFSNAANFATAERDDRLMITGTVMPEVRWIYATLNKQLLNPVGLHIVAKPQSLSIMQEDEEQRAGSLALLVQAGYPLLMASDILGYSLTDDQRAELEGDGDDVEGGELKQEKVLNGAQITSAIGIIAANVKDGIFPRRIAVNMITRFYNLDRDMVDAELVPLESEIDLPEPAPVPPQFQPADIVATEEKRLKTYVRHGNHLKRAFQSDVLSQSRIEEITQEVTGGKKAKATEGDVGRALRSFEGWAKEHDPEMAQLLNAEMTDGDDKSSNG